MLRFIKIEKLFDIYSYHLELTSKDNYPVRYLTGPNGYGKTTVLELLYSILSGNYERLFTVQYRSITLGFDDLQVNVWRHVRTIQDDGSDVIRVAENSVTIEVRSSNGSMQNFEAGRPEEIGGMLDLYLNAQDVFYLTDTRVIRNSTSYTSGEYQSMAKTLWECAKEVQYIVAENLFNPSLGGLKISDHSVSESDYNSFLAIVGPRVERLRRVGVVDKDFRLFVYAEGTAFLLDSYMRIVQEELVRIENRVKKLLLFAEWVDKSVFSNKVLRVGRECGFQFYSGENNSRPLLFEELSSGERHLLLQIYALVFAAPEGAIVLLDEPELSMHLYWQLHYGDMVAGIAQQRQLQCIVATHSPQIFAGVWNHAVDLYRQSKWE